MPDTTVSDQARLFRADRDQHITEYHTHIAATLGALGDQEWAGPDSVRVPLTARMHSPIRDRSTLRETLLEAALESDPAAQDIHVIHGMPGCGKTAVALTVFDEAVGGHGVVGLWVNASSTTSFRAGMLAVATDRGASQDEVDAARLNRRPAADLVWHHLDRSSERWLLVLDNADDPAVFQEPGWLRSSRRGTILVTTRHGDSPLWRGAARHSLGVLSVGDAVDVLLDFQVGDGDLAALESLAHTLGCHPLALILAGTYLGQQVLELVTVQDYLDRLREDPSAVLDQGASPGEPDLRRLISSTWQLSLGALHRQGLAEATTMLRVLSCYAPDPLPVGVLAPSRLDTTGLPHADPPLTGGQANTAVLGLRSQSLITLHEVPGDSGRPAVRTMQAHALLLETVAARIPLDQRDIVHTAAADLLAGLLATGDNMYIDGQTLRLFAPHAMALLRRTASMSTAATASALAIVRSLRAQSYARGDYTAAHTLATEAADVTRHESSADALSDRYELARTLSGTGRFAEAADMHRETLEAREALLGTEHPDTLASAHALGLALYGLGRWAEDEQYMRRAADGRHRVLGPEHPDTLETRACLSDAIGEQGRWAEAEALSRPNLALSERALGQEHPHTLQCRIALAWVLSRSDQWEEAERLARTTVEGSEQVLGPEHPRTLAARDLLSGILLRQGNWSQAEHVASTVLETRKRALGSEHPHTLAIQSRLALILLGAGRKQQARELSAQALLTSTRVLGPEHPGTVNCRDVHERTIAQETHEPPWHHKDTEH
jgi:tetratricopeptide (TPR) repeat protein